MIKRKREKRISDNIGKTQFNFDIQLERGIYSYLYGIRASKNSKKFLDEQFKFCFYSDWKKYIQNKYKNYDCEKLNNFRKYLCQKIRNEKPAFEYWKMSIPVLMSVIISQLTEMIRNILNIRYSTTSFFIVATWLSVIIVMILPVIYIVYSLIAVLWDSNADKDLLEDYIEVIDILIDEKQKRKNENRKRKKRR